MRKVVLGILLLLYLLVIAFFAFRPFEPITGLGYGDVALNLGNDAVHIRKGAALEDRQNVPRMRKALMKSGQMSLVVDLRMDATSRRMTGRILAYDRDCMGLNFALAQEGNGVSFLLRTTSPGRGTLPSDLLVPAVLATNGWQQLVVTYDGSMTRLFVDGQLHGARSHMAGDFSNWGLNHALVIGDNPAGGQPWSGDIRSIMIYDHALGTKEVGELQQGKPLPGAVIKYDFRTIDDQASMHRSGLVRLRYRNLFVASDSSTSGVDDNVMNILGFLPLGFFVYIALPQWLERRKILATILIPVVVGLFISGSIETLQRYIMSRVPSALDVVNNVTGTLLGGLLAWLVNSTFQKRRRGGSQTSSGIGSPTA